MVKGCPDVAPLNSIDVPIASLIVGSQSLVHEVGRFGVIKSNTSE